MVSLVDPDVVCFLLEEDIGAVWMVEVNMRTKVLQSRRPFDGRLKTLSLILLEHHKQGN